MPASNFDDVLTIDGKGEISPRGPLGLKPGETVQKLYAWVFQQNAVEDGVCIATQEDPVKLAGPGWTTGAVQQGSFQDGGAIGMAVTISRDAGGKTRVYWWSETIYLKT